MVRFYIPLRCWLELFVSASKHSVVTNGSPLTSWKSNTQKIADCKKTWKIVSASKHGVVQHNSFSVMISTSLFEALFSSRFQTTLLRQIFWPGQEMVYHWCIFLMMIVLRHLQLVLCEYYGAAEPPVRCGESHLSGLTDEYSCAVTPQVRQTGNRLSGPAGTAYASLLT